VGALKGLFLGDVVDLLHLGKRSNILGGDRDRLRRRAPEDVGHDLDSLLDPPEGLAQVDRHQAE